MPSKNFASSVERLLRKYGIDEPPINLELIAAGLGVHVEYARMADSLSGFLSTKGGERVIGVNSKHHSNRQRFTLAHEIAHLVLEHDTGEVHVDKPLRGGTARS